ncbi:MAG: diguanylate cyclase domain-containing protein [Culicoidibacterales bacterium]
MEKSLLIEILENQENGIIILNKEKQLIYVNNRIKKIFGATNQQLLVNYLNVQPLQANGKSQIDEINELLDYVIATKETQILPQFMTMNNLDEIKMTLKVSFVNNQILIELFDFVNSNFEISLLLRLAEESKDLLFFKDATLKYYYVNQNYLNFHEKDKTYILGKSDEDLLTENLISEEIYERWRASDEICLEQGNYYEIESKNGEYFRVSKEKIKNGILGIVRNVTTEHQALEKAEIDQLTGTHSRHKFKEYIENIYKNQKDTYYLALIDLDDLRGLNNEYGHLKGDNYLKAIGHILRAQTDATFFRIGGDEFIGLIDETKASPLEMFNTINEALRNLNYIPPLTISVGIHHFDLSKSYEENYEAADVLLYKVKNAGKNSVLIEYK